MVNDAEIWVVICTELGRKKRTEEAIDAFNKALMFDPSYANAWHYKGIALGQLNRAEEAEVCFQRTKVEVPERSP